MHRNILNVTLLYVASKLVIGLKYPNLRCLFGEGVLKVPILSEFKKLEHAHISNCGKQPNVIIGKGWMNVTEFKRK